ncbi:acyl-CoA dehydrogenase family protein [Rhodococcus sp. Q1]|uniref:acyl-CoA dehydrogenase family protein n=1 Tax=unclassified Rhodococcus (in: high G+C Gram-positive bacteria) TaxID=192944 RepID=UPI0013EB3511|nr:acyl-CoA dehydrogenase family protein [Rhodococcus sp. Q1]
MTERSMDFSFDEQQQIVHELAVSVFAKHSTDERVAELERAGQAFDSELWTRLIDTGLLDVVLPAEIGGGGVGTVGLAIVLEQQGRHLSRVPLVSTSIAASALAEFGDVDSPALPSIRDGSARIAVAVSDPWGSVRAEGHDYGWVLNGSLPQVYLAGSCTHVLVLADDSRCTRTFLLSLERDGLEVDRFEGISRNIHASIDFNSVHVDNRDLVGRPSHSGDPARWIRTRLLTGIAALELGLCEEAVKRTAEYTSTREQFGRPLSTNQGVAMRAADAYIDTEAIRLTMLDAAWQLDQGEDAATAALVAAWWAREGGVRVVHATQHLHGGMGADVDNHIHRFFLWVRELDIVAGPAPALLDELSAVLTAGI